MLGITSMVKVGIISIGDELLNGFTIDTNSQWIKEKLQKYIERCVEGQKERVPISLWRENKRAAQEEVEDDNPWRPGSHFKPERDIHDTGLRIPQRLKPSQTSKLARSSGQSPYACRIGHGARARR